MGEPPGGVRGPNRVQNVSRGNGKVRGGWLRAREDMLRAFDVNWTLKEVQKLNPEGYAVSGVAEVRGSSGGAHTYGGVKGLTRACDESMET